MAYQILPALIALVFKLVLLAYALRAPRKHPTTRLFVGLLALFAAHNLVEVLLLGRYTSRGLDNSVEFYGYLYFVIGILFFAVLLHVSLRLSADQWERWRPLVWIVYLPVPILEYLLLATDTLVAGFKPFSSYTVMRSPGPLYFLFEAYVPLYLTAAVVYLVYGARPSRMPVINKIRNRTWLIALLPFVLLNAYLILANHFGLAKLSSTVSLPVALTFFLMVTTYATHQYRLFDIEFFLPWSKVRKRKTVFYQRIQATVAELADLRTVDEALSRVSDILRCPTALVDHSRPVLAHAGDGAVEMARFPGEQLKRINHIVVANEIGEAMPELHRLMQQFHVAAIVPFYPRSEATASWMLLGDSFSDSVYTPLDFKNVERLFDGLGEFFLDKLAYLRTELGHVEQQARDAHERLQRLERELTALHEEQSRLHDSRLHLLRENRTLQQALDPAPANRRAPALKAVPTGQLEPEKSLEGQIAALEARLIREALTSCNGNADVAAQLLGLDSAVLRDKIERHGLHNRSGTGE